jgi:hypothetical protein
MGEKHVPNSGSAVKVPPAHESYEGKCVSQVIQEFNSSQIFVRVNVEEKEGITTSLLDFSPPPTIFGTWCIRHV